MVTTSVVTSQIQDYLHLSKLEFALGSKCLLVTLMVKNPPANAGDPGDLGLIPGQEDPLEEVMAPTPVLPGESRGQRSLAGYSPLCHKE